MPPGLLSRIMETVEKTMRHIPVREGSRYEVQPPRHADKGLTGPRRKRARKIADLDFSEGRDPLHANSEATKPEAMKPKLPVKH
jgi:hypothetical protein